MALSGYLTTVGDLIVRRDDYETSWLILHYILGFDPRFNYADGYV